MLDAYCGIGTISMVAAKQAGEVLGVELNEAAIADAKKNARKNNCNNVRFIAADAGEFMVKLAEQKKKYNMPPAEEENDLLKIATSAQGSEEKICYLTFDDGPTKEVTPKVLDILKQYDVKATFFVLGKMLDTNRDIAKRAFDEGHLIANHSYYHQYAELYASSESFCGEIDKTYQLICEVTGAEPFKLVRFPGGGHNAGDYGTVKQEYKQVLKEKGYYHVDWNCLNGDAEDALRSADALIARVRETAIGKNIVVLMHDAAAKTTTPDALGSIIEYLKSKGYVFKRLDEVEYYAEPEVQEASMIL